MVKGGVSLEQFVSRGKASDPRAQAKHAATMEEMRVVSGQGPGGQTSAMEQFWSVHVCPFTSCDCSVGPEGTTGARRTQEGLAGAQG